MKLGMVGLPNTGKSTLFNALLGTGAQSSNYPFSTIKPNVGIVTVPDPRLDRLAEIYEPDKFTPATLEFVDIAGLVRGSSKGEGLGNKFLSSIAGVDALIHVVRCFEDENVVHVEGNIGAARDMEIVNLELIFSDIEMTERRIERLKKLLKGDKKLQTEIDLLNQLKDHLESGNPARTFGDEDTELPKELQLLSLKPVIYAANLSEKDFDNGIESNPHYLEVKKQADSDRAAVMPICAKFEEEISDMSPDDKKAFLAEIGATGSGLDSIIREGYALLGLISFLTAAKQEVRAWTIRKGLKAPAAAGKIHSDLERGFIRAETVAYDDLVACGSIAVAKEKGLVRLEGKEYVMADGDVVLFRFNV
ncbi:MAG: redox-regulated ATPase YchF [Oscillospiraceae bacterium]|nr:redox-regulated ATPase YchF [Oscillospiraceae bacterium]